MLAILAVYDGLMSRQEVYLKPDVSRLSRLSRWLHRARWRDLA